MNEGDPFKSLIEQGLTGNEKFDTCKFRSEYEESRFIKTCHCVENSTIEMVGFVCDEANIFPVHAGVCQYCKFYKRKDV